MSESLEQAGAAADQLDASQPAGSAVAACPTEGTWIEIEIVDAIGRPVADEAFRLTCPDGSERSGKTDARGLARVEGIAGGACTLSFTALDQDAWSARP